MRHRGGPGGTRGEAGRRDARELRPRAAGRAMLGRRAVHRVRAGHVALVVPEGRCRLRAAAAQAPFQRRPRPETGRGARVLHVHAEPGGEREDGAMGDGNPAAHRGEAAPGDCPAHTREWHGASIRGSPGPCGFFRTRRGRDSSCAVCAKLSRPEPRRPPEPGRGAGGRSTGSTSIECSHCTACGSWLRARRSCARNPRGR